MTDAAPARNQRGRDTRTRILAAADLCFEQHGLNLTLDEVASAAGTTRMTVHRHTGGREQLVTRLVLRASVRLADGLREVLDRPDPFEARFADALVLTVVTIRDTPSLARLFAAGDPTDPWPEIDPENRVLSIVHEFFRPYVGAAFVAGALRPDVDPEAAVSWLLAQVLLVLMVPAIAPHQAALHDQFTRFVLPAISAQ
ncbi:MAG: TetR/AcrR family transcriptional regulator [Aquihabitans sp.]